LPQTPSYFSHFVASLQFRRLEAFVGETQ